MTSDQILNQIAVAKPCPADWGDMSGDDRVRFCGQCRKHVYNIREIPAADVLRLIQQSEGDLCVRLHRRQDGTVLNGDCPVGVRRVWSRWKRLVGVVTAAAVVGLSAKMAPSLETGMPRLSVGAPAAPSAPSPPGPVRLAVRDFMASLRDWLGIGPAPYSAPPMGQMVEMGDVCLPEDWQGTNSGGPDQTGDPGPPADLSNSGS